MGKTVINEGPWPATSDVIRRTAIEKFVEAMNRNTPYWTKTITVQAKLGRIETIHYDGEVYKDD